MKTNRTTHADTHPRINRTAGLSPSMPSSRELVILMLGLWSGNGLDFNISCSPVQQKSGEISCPIFPDMSPNLVTALKGERKGVLMWSALPIRGEGMLKNE
jgi:hypothetical protein